MARPVRIEFINAVYYLSARSTSHRPIFLNDQDRRMWLHTLAQAVDQHGIIVHGFCLVPNEFHLLVQTPRANLSRAIGWFQTTYSVRFNRDHDRSGHLFRGRFKAHLVEPDVYARQLLRHLHLFPIRPKDSSQPIPKENLQTLDGYIWSSHRYYAGLAKAPPWLSLEWLRYWHTETKTAAREYRKDLRTSKKMTSPLTDVRGGLALVSNAFWVKLRKHLEAKRRGEERVWNTQMKSSRIKTVNQLLKREPDRRIQIWLRVIHLGEPRVTVANQYGYADGSAVTQVLKRLEQAAQRDSELANKLAGLNELLSLRRVPTN